MRMVRLLGNITTTRTCCMASSEFLPTARSLEKTVTDRPGPKGKRTRLPSGQWQRRLLPCDLMRQRRRDPQPTRGRGRHQGAFEEGVDQGLTAAQELLGERAAQVLVNRRREQCLRDEARKLAWISAGGLPQRQRMRQALDYRGHQKARGGLHDIGGRRVAADHVKAAEHLEGG